MAYFSAVSPSKTERSSEMHHTM